MDRWSASTIGRMDGAPAATGTRLAVRGVSASASATRAFAQSWASRPGMFTSRPVAVRWNVSATVGSFAIAVAMASR
jgi:hypothetical protein